MNYEEELAYIQKRDGGVLRPEAVVEYAADPTTALHGRFCWDDTKAAHEYRLWQARELIKAVVTILPNHTEPVSAWVSLTTDRVKPGGGYRAIVDVFSDRELHAQLLADAFAEFKRFEQKYRTLVELRPLFAEARRIRKRVEKECAEKEAA